MRRELAVVEPLSLLNGVYLLTDLREATDIVKKQVVQIRRDTLHLYPHDLFCNCTTGRDADRLTRRVAQSADELAVIDARIAAINKEGVRSSLDEYLGEITPLDFVIHREGVFFGALQIFGITVINETDERIEIQCGWWPAFPVRASIERVVRLSMEIVTEFLDKRMPLENGQVLDVRRWDVPIVEDEARSAELAFVTKALSESTERVELYVEKVDIPGQLGRKHLRLSRSEAPRQTHDDPFDPERPAPRPSRSGD